MAALVEPTKVSELPGTCRVLQLLESEIVVRAPGGTTVQRTPRRIRHVLERMSLANLVSLICSTLRGRFPKLMAIELKDLRETAKILESWTQPVLKDTGSARRRLCCTTIYTAHMLCTCRTCIVSLHLTVWIAFDFESFFQQKIID